MPALPTGIITQLTSGEPHPKLKQAYLVAWDMGGAPDNPPWLEKGADRIAFQYWPESVTDSRQVEWNPRSIPGGSHPIYQWTQSGERRLAFTAVFTRDKEPEIEEGDSGGGISGLVDAAVGAVNDAATAIGLAGSHEGDKFRDVNIEAAISWLRWFTYPYYAPDDLRVFEPAKCLLVMPNSKIGHDGTDDIISVMTQCEVTYEAFYPNGAARIVEVSLEFAEVVQHDDAVRFHSRGDMKDVASGVGDSLGILPDSGESGGILESIGGVLGL